MWICHCHAVNDGTIKEYAKKPGATWKQMTIDLKVSTQCGICAKEAKRIFDAAAGKTPRKRKKKVSATNAPATNAPAQEAPVINAQAANVVSDSSPQPAQTSSPALLPCGKCTCTCGK